MQLASHRLTILQDVFPGIAVHLGEHSSRYLGLGIGLIIAEVLLLPSIPIGCTVTGAQSADVTFSPAAHSTMITVQPSHAYDISLTGLY